MAVTVLCEITSSPAGDGRAFSRVRGGFGVSALNLVGPRTERVTLQDHATLDCSTKRYAGKKDSPDQFPVSYSIKVIRMAPRRPAQPKPESPILTVEQKRRRIDRLQKCIDELESFDPQKVQKRCREPEVMRLQAAIKEALSAAFGHKTPAYDRYSDAAILDYGPHTLRMGPAFGRGPQIDYDAQEAHEARQYFAEGKQQSIVLLRQAISTLKDEIADQEEDSQGELITREGAPESHERKVFVVHGHDHGAKDAMARFLEKIELQAIILHEQPDQGFTIIEKFETYAKQVAFAVVLLTPDDLGGPVSASAQTTRARQNVIFELGYFAGKLGRGRACLLRKGDVEIPSDLYGVIYTDMDAAEGWKLKLVKELKAAGLHFDANKVWV